MFNKSLILTVVFMCISLSGCSGEPSASEIAKAVGESFKNESSILSGNKLIGVAVNAAGVEAIKLDSVDKIGCEPSGKNAYTCEVSVEFTVNSAEGSIADLLGAGGHKRTINKYRLVSTSRGWIVAQGSN
jgi:hypothetical protein